MKICGYFWIGRPYKVYCIIFGRPCCLVRIAESGKSADLKLFLHLLHPDNEIIENVFIFAIFQDMVSRYHIYCGNYLEYNRVHLIRIDI